MSGRKPVADMTITELGATLHALTRDELEHALTYISGFAPIALDHALAAVDRGRAVTRARAAARTGGGKPA